MNNNYRTKLESKKVLGNALAYEVPHLKKLAVCTDDYLKDQYEI